MTLLEWIEHAKVLGWSDEFIIAQIELVARGVRGVELHDHTCHLTAILEPIKILKSRRREPIRLHNDDGTLK
jgi:hypothetical protein